MTGRVAAAALSSNELLEGESQALKSQMNRNDCVEGDSSAARAACAQGAFSSCSFAGLCNPLGLGGALRCLGRERGRIAAPHRLALHFGHLPSLCLFVFFPLTLNVNYRGFDTVREEENEAPVLH